MKRPRWSVVALGVSGLVGCGQASFTDVKTSGIDAEITVLAQSATQARVSVELYPANRDPYERIDLQRGVTLTAEVAGQSKVLTKNALTYEATFDLGAADSEVRVRLDRAMPDDLDAPDSVGTLPAPFELDGLAKAQFARSEPVVVTWSPSGTSDPMALAVSGDCIASQILAVYDDPGTYTLAPGTLILSDGADAATASCTVNVVLRRARVASVDPNLSAVSSFLLEQVRSTAFSTTP
jgi:hypothetical protein